MPSSKYLLLCFYQILVLSGLALYKLSLSVLLKEPSPICLIREENQMQYHAVNGRCAVHIPSLNLPITRIEALGLLKSLGFVITQVDMSMLARSCVGQSEYQLGVQAQDAPKRVDCSSLTKWLYAQRGIWIPRLSIQQRMYGVRVNCQDVRVHDLVFTTGVHNFYETDPTDTVGHVGIVTSPTTVVHAVSVRTGVRETSIHNFIKKNFRGACRIIHDTHVLTLLTPNHLTIESSDDVRWLLLKHL